MTATMTVHELTREQLTQLKQCYYEWVVRKNKGVSWDELAMIDELVSDEEVFRFYEGYSFTNDDFLH